MACSISTAFNGPLLCATQSPSGYRLVVGRGAGSVEQGGLTLSYRVAKGTAVPLVRAVPANDAGPATWVNAECVARSVFGPISRHNRHALDEAHEIGH